MATCEKLLVIVIVIQVALGTDQQFPHEAFTALARIFSDTNERLPWKLDTSLLSKTLDLPTHPSVNQDCLRDLNEYQSKHLQRSKQNRWAFKMFDASTKFPDGLSFGHLVHMGNFDECLSIRGIQGTKPGAPAFDGRHCMITFTARIPPMTPVPDDPLDGERMDQWNMLRAIKTGNLLLATSVAANAPRDASSVIRVPLQVAWCLPSSCQVEDVKALAAQAAASINQSNAGVVVEVTVDPEQCHVQGETSLRAIDIFAICFLGLFVALAIASTAFDVITQHNKNRPSILLSFSVYSNWPRLIAVNSKGDQLYCLNGIRAISIGWVVLGHVYLISVNMPTINSLEYAPKFMASLSRLVITNSSLAVDSFLFMSGLLVSFLFMKQVQRTNRFNIIKFYVHRYLRLTPSMAILILLTVTIFNYAGSGPFWDSETNEIKHNCEDNWWTNIIYVNNYVNPHHMCLGHSWYLAVDMQLYLLSPLILIPMWKVGKRNTSVMILFLLLVGWAIPFTVVYLMELYPGTYVGPIDKQMETTQYYYWSTHARFVPWLIGVYLGYILVDARKNKIELSPCWVTLGWILSTIFMTGALNGEYPFQQLNYKYDKLEAAFWLSLFRPIWTIGLAWIVFACDQGFGGIVNIILSWGFWQPLARLAYGVYLVHFSILHLFSGVVQTPIYLADVNTIPQFFGVLVMSIAWAIPLALLFEMPFIAIEKSILGGRPVPQRSRRASQVSATPSKSPQGRRWSDAVMENRNLTLPRVRNPDPMNLTTSNI